MVRSKFLLAACLVAASAAFCSCDPTELQELLDQYKVSISATNPEFDANGNAGLTVTLSGVSPVNVTVDIAVGNKAQEGYTAVPADALTYPSTVSIAKGNNNVKLDVAVDLAKVEPGMQAVFTISAVDGDGVSVDKDAVTAYILVPQFYNGGDENKPVEGESEWSVIGALLGTTWDTDFVAAKDGDIYVVKNVKLEAADEFKFRFQKDWAVNRGGNFTELGKGFECTQDGPNVKVGAAGTYDLYYNAAKEQIGVVAAGGNIEWYTAPIDNPGELNWNVQYLGCQWIEGYYADGQLEIIEVSNTDVEKYYHVFLLDLAEEDGIDALIAEDADVFFATLQDDLDEYIAEDMEYWGDTFEEALYYTLYNEGNDGTELLFEGLPAGNYQFAVLPISVDWDNEKVQFDKTYKVLNFSKTEDAEQIYDWGFNLNLREDWSAEYDGWIEGYEGKYYWVVGNAPGAAYVVIDSYTDDELIEYYDGNLNDVFNVTQSNVKDYIAAGYTMEELADYGLLAITDEDGAFETYLSTYGLTGLTNVYVLGFDEEGNLLNDYGKSEVDIPVYEEPEEEPIEWVERTDWAVNYDPEVETEYEDYPQAVVVTTCDAKYFDLSVFGEGVVDYYGVDFLANYLGDWSGAVSKGYTMDELVEMGNVVTPEMLPYVYAYSGLENGYEALILAYDENGKFTGEWHWESLTGIPEEHLEMTLVEDWSITPVGETYYDEEVEYYVVDVEASLPGILYYFAEENTAEDLENYYDGEVENIALGYAEFIQEAIEDEGYTIDEICAEVICMGSEANPLSGIYAYNPGLETTIYVVEYDEDGVPTGRYGATTVVLPDLAEEEGGEPSIEKASIKKGAPVKIRFVQNNGKSNIVVAKTNIDRASAMNSLPKKVRKAVKVENSFSVKTKANATAKPATVAKALNKKQR